MSRYKGTLKKTAVERQFPHHVDIAVPEGPLGRRLDAMYQFHAPPKSCRKVGLSIIAFRIAKRMLTIAPWIKQSPTLAR